jgi:signal transduction histidine kinase
MVIPDQDARSALKAVAEAGIAITSELSLQSVLETLVRVACGRVRARYAALSVLGADGAIAQFITEGVTAEERAAIGHVPVGSGLLGVLLREGESLRIDDMSKDPRHVGFPENHPPMKSVLGVPLTFGRRIIGNLYVTDRLDGKPFTEEDRELLSLLAAQASVAVRNAELYEAQLRRTEEWRALFELGQEVTASPRIKEVFESVVERAQRLLGTDVVTLMLVTSDRKSLRLAAQRGVRDPDVRKMEIANAGVQALALESGGTVTIPDFEQDQRLKNSKSHFASTERLQSMIIVPLAAKQDLMGTLMVANRRKTEFSPQEVELLEAFANWTSVAIESSQFYDKMESLARLEERERIGMDLHDGVMQSIYAVGLQLEAGLERLDDSPDESKDIVERAIETLNSVIKDIRSYIMDLRPRVSVVADLPDAIQQLVEDVRVNTLVEAEVTIDGSVAGLSVINQTEAIALFHIAQEALSNVIKHSRASHVAVRLSVDDRAVAVEVRDNGVGIDERRAEAYDRQGLRNMRDRARSVGANLVLDSQPGRGTTVRVELPLRNEGDSDE